MDALTIKNVSIVSSASAITQTQFYSCHKIGNVFYLNGYINVSTEIGANSSFMHFDLTAPVGRHYFPSGSKQIIMNNSGYLYCESALPAGYYFFDTVALVN